MKHYHIRPTFILLPIVLLTALKHADCDNITLSTNDLSVKIKNKATFNIIIKGYTKPKVINLKVQHDDIVRLKQKTIPITHNGQYPIEVQGIGAGHSSVQVANSTNVDASNLFVRVKVYKVRALDDVSSVIGWLYFTAWSISFYPQVYENWKRKSVIGLNLDFVLLNFIGFVLYSVFNLGLYFDSYIEEEYFKRYPRGVNPVQINDVFFSLHASIITAVTIAQCFIYERGDQKISTTAYVIVGIFAAFLGISFIITTANVLHWLDFLYFCSYVKLTITLIKYVPQAYQNYKRKSTVGWSIWNVLLDFTGGLLSMLQMLIIAYNYDDWVSIFGDPTKFGLGLFSVIFDIFFIIQHYVLYNESKSEDSENSSKSSLTSSSSTSTVSSSNTS